MTTQLDSLRRYVAQTPSALVPGGPEGVLLVGSGKGGVGTSTVSALIAVMSAADGNDVLIIDADESHGALPLLFGVEPTGSLGDLRGGGTTPEDLLVELGHGLALLPAGGQNESTLQPAERRNLLRRVTGLFDDFDVVIVDTGSRLQQVLSVASVMGNRLLAVTAAERISAAATYALAKVIDQKHEEMKIDLVFNHCALTAATEAFREVDGATRHFLRRSLGFAGAIPTDERLRRAVEAGYPVQEAAALGSPATAACHELAAKLLNSFAGQSQRGSTVLGSSNQRSAYRA